MMLKIGSFETLGVNTDEKESIGLVRADGLWLSLAKVQQ